MRIKSEQKIGPDWSTVDPSLLFSTIAQEKCQEDGSFSCTVLFSNKLLKFLLYFVSLKGLNIFAQIIEKSHSHFPFWNIFKITSF